MSNECSIQHSFKATPYKLNHRQRIGSDIPMETEMLAFMVILTVATSFVVEQLFMD